MSRADVRATLWAIGDVAAGLGGDPSERALAPGILFAVNCAEELEFDTPAAVQRYLDASPYPGLALYTGEEFEALYPPICRFFPPSAVSPGIQDPVASATPALLFVEWLDTQTPCPWGLLAQETLRRAYRVDWTREGHVIANRSPDGCAGAIVTAFVADPQREPDARCARAPSNTLSFVPPA